MSDVIETKQLCKNYDNQFALYPVDFTLKKGEICALIGRNGAGKSTFIKLIANQISPSDGQIKLFGKSDKVKNEMRKRIGFLIDTSVFIPQFNAKQNLEYFAIQNGGVNQSYIQDVLLKVGLGEETKKVKSYSLGMKQRLGIALALLNGPDVLVLDEPINGLDVEGIRDFRNLVIQLNKEYGITILIASHILSELQQIATQFVFIEKGKIVESVSRDVLFKKVTKSILIKVDRTSKAVQVLDLCDKNLEYKVLSDDTISIKSNVMNASEINDLLWKSDIRVYQIQEKGFDLEDYFFIEERGEI